MSDLPPPEMLAEVIEGYHDPEPCMREPGEDPEEEVGPAPFPMLDSVAFAAAVYHQEWLIQHVLTSMQPAIVGGPRKALKTLLLCDMAISLGAGLPFLGRFVVPRPVRVGFISGESGPFVLQREARTISKTKGIDLADADVHWGFELPQLSSAEHLGRLRRTILEHGLKLVILDPAYLCLLNGNREVEASNLFQMGPLLSAVTSTCLDAQAAPVLVYHSIKRPPNPHAMPELEDLQFAGAQEFARQWLLLARREKYAPGSGQHKLWMNIGGSAGFSSGWAIDILEGVVGDDFQGKSWDVTVQPASESLSGAAASKADARRLEQESRSLTE